MCYTIKIDHTREELEKRFGAKFSQPDDYKTGSKVNSFSLPLLPVICSDNPAEIRLYYWGLIPYWIKDASGAREIRMKTFNARSETLADKPSFRSSLNRKRCLVLANGFYEWPTLDKNKIPYYIGLIHQPVFAMAGLFDQWSNLDTGEVLNTFTVITTRANPMMEQIHNIMKRMPVILSSDNEQRWLDIRTEPVKTGIFEPFPEEMMYSELIK
ncbi:MAG TPA: SOS response-associated peptidase [Bacteroidales bacterium]|nr:SOS response-associated peptidase [Bacteroidales bacterium]